MGYEFNIKPISPILIDKVQKTIPVPEPPTYIAETVGGGQEIHVHDESTLESPEDHAAWATYKRELADYQSSVTDKLLELFILMGVDLELPEDDSWVEEHKYLGLEVPVDDRRALKVYWVSNVVLGSGEDLTGLMFEVMKGTGVDQEVLDSVQDSFRRSVQADPIEEADGEATTK